MGWLGGVMVVVVVEVVMVVVYYPYPKGPANLTPYPWWLSPVLDQCTTLTESLGRLDSVCGAIHGAGSSCFDLTEREVM